MQISTYSAYSSKHLFGRCGRNTIVNVVSGNDMTNSVPLSVYDGPRHNGPGRGDANKANFGLFIAGAIVTVFGILCLRSPHLATTTMALFMGVGLVIAGVIMIVLHMGSSWSIFRSSGILAPSAVVTLVVGLIICLEPVMTGRLFSVVIGVAILGMGVLQIGSFMALRPQQSLRWYAVFLTGVIECVIALVLVFVPDVIGIAVGIFALLHGLLMISLSLPLSR